MNNLKIGTAAILVGVLAGCATQTGETTAQNASPKVINVTNDTKYRWGEHLVAVNPKNPKNIVYATVGLGFTQDCQQHNPDCKMVEATFAPGIKFEQARGIFDNPQFAVVAAYSSMDGGKTWSRAIVPATPVGHPDIKSSGDPSVTATPDGTFYIGFDAMNWGTAEKPQPNAGIGVSKSTDGGKTWSAPHLSGTPTDGPKVLSDANTGTVYSASSTFLGPHSTGDASSPQGKKMDRWIASSKDGVTWTPPQGAGGMAMTVSAANGVLATGFQTVAQMNMFGSPNSDLCGNAPKPCFIFQTSKDNGATWDRHVMNIPQGAPASGMGFGDQPMVAADPAKAGHFAVAVPHGGKEFNVYQTKDSGNTWTGPVVVSEDATKQHYHAALAFSRQGTLGIMWRTMQPAPGQPAPTGAPAGGPGGGTPYAYNVWAAVSTDGGTTFSAPLKVSDKDSLAPESGMFGNAGDDYSSITIDADNVYVGWAQWQTADQRQGYLALLKVADFKAKH